VRTAVLGAATLAAAVAMTLLLALTDLDVASVIVAGFLAAFAVLAAFAIACAVTGTAGRSARVCDDDGTGGCTRCGPVGDDTLAMLKPPDPVAAAEAEIEQWVRDWDRENRRG
jgi:hypothetical protein